LARLQKLQKSEPSQQLCDALAEYQQANHHRHEDATAESARRKPQKGVKKNPAFLPNMR
jgi:hypothetical protein